MAKTTKKKAEEITQTVQAEEILHTEPAVDPSKIIHLDEKGLTVEEQAKREVAKIDVSRTWIATAKAKYSLLTINGVDDQDGFKKVAEAYREVRTKRLDVEKMHAAIKEPHLKICQALDKEKRDLTALLTEVEKPLGDMLDNIEAEIKAFNKRREDAAAQLLMERVNELKANGMTFNGNYYEIGPSISMTTPVIQSFNDAEFSTFLEKVKAESNRLKEAEEDRKRLLKAEQDRQEELRVKNEEAAQELKKEQTRMKKELAESRGEFLENLGYVKSVMGNYEYIKAKDLYASVDGDSLGEMTREKWEEMKAYSKQAVKEIDETFNSRQTYQERINNMANMGVYTAGNSVVFASPDPAKRGKPVVICTIEELKEANQDKYLEIYEGAKVSINSETIRYQEEQQKEKERALRIANHKSDLLIRGFEVLGSGVDYVYKSQYDDKLQVLITVDQVEDYDSAAWDSMLKVVVGTINTIKKHDISHKETLEAQKEADRKAALTDTEKVTEWMQGIAGQMAKRPPVVNERMKTTLAVFDGVFTEAFDSVMSVVNDINNIQ